MKWIERRLALGDLSIQPEGDPVIASLFVDDGMPGINPMRLHQPHWGHKPEVPNAVVAEFADLVEREDLAGKFSVVPYPLGLGRIDQEIPGVSERVVNEFLDIVRGRLAGRFDFTPEVVTHGPAIDPVTRFITHLTEKEWGADASASEWREYIRMAFTLFANVGLTPGGVTSPWDTAIENEDPYARGLVAAGSGFGVDVSFYFLHMARSVEEAMPEVRVWQPGSDGLSPRAAVSLKCAGFDPLWPTQYGKGPKVDPLVTAGGGDGILTALGDVGAPMVVGTHWQSLYGNGARRAPEVVADIAHRLRDRYGRRLTWWSAGKMARFAAGAYAAKIETTRDGEVFLELPLALESAHVRFLPSRGVRLRVNMPQRENARTWEVNDGGELTIQGDLSGRVTIADLDSSVVS